MFFVSHLYNISPLQLTVYWHPQERNILEKLKWGRKIRCLPIPGTSENGTGVRARNSRESYNIFVSLRIERFSYDLEMNTREQNRNNKRTEIERFDWFIERTLTCVAFDWLSERSGEKTSCPKNFVEINRYFALTSNCNTIGQSNNPFSILRFFLAGKRRVHVLIFSSIGW